MRVTPMMATPYQIFRRCETGVSEYRFEKNHVLLGSVTIPMSGRYFSVYIQGNGLELLSVLDVDMTIFPGCSREILTQDDGVPFAKVVYHAEGKHSLVIGRETIRINSRGGTHHFYKDDVLIARMYSTSTEMSNIIPPAWDWQLRLTMSVTRPVSLDLILLMMSFPMLQIAP